MLLKGENSWNSAKPWVTFLGSGREERKKKKLISNNFTVKNVLWFHWFTCTTGLHEPIALALIYGETKDPSVLKFD